MRPSDSRIYPAKQGRAVPLVRLRRRFDSEFGWRSAPAVVFRMRASDSRIFPGRAVGWIATVVRFTVFQPRSSAISTSYRLIQGSARPDRHEPLVRLRPCIVLTHPAESQSNGHHHHQGFVRAYRWSPGCPDRGFWSIGWVTGLSTELRYSGVCFGFQGARIHRVLVIFTLGIYASFVANRNAARLFNLDRGKEVLQT